MFNKNMFLIHLSMVHLKHAVYGQQNVCRYKLDYNSRDVLISLKRPAIKTEIYLKWGYAECEILLFISSQTVAVVRSSYIYSTGTSRANKKRSKLVFLSQGGKNQLCLDDIKL